MIFAGKSTDFCVKIFRTSEEIQKIKSSGEKISGDKNVFLHVYIYVSERTILVAVLYQFSWNSLGWCRSTHEWTLLFLETIGPIEPPIWGKIYPKNRFLALNQPVWIFLIEKLKNSIRYLISCRNGYIQFCHPVLQSLNNGHAPPPKMVFAIFSENVVFFEENF